MFDAIDRWMGRFVDARLLGIPAPVAALFLYFLVNFALSAWLGGTVWYDDREQLVHMQAWAWGYKAVQPPLYTWLVKLLDLLVGDDRNAVVAARYLLLFATTALIYAAGQLAGFSRAACAAGAIGCLLSPQLVWEGQRSLSHSLMLMFGIVLALNAILIIHRGGDRLGHALLGVAVATVLLGKYSGLFVLAAFALAAVSVPEIRRSFSATGLALAALLAAGLLARPALWLVENAPMTDKGVASLQGDRAGSFLAPRLEGALSFANAFLLYAAVPLVAVVVCRFIAKRRGLRVPEPTPAGPAERFLVIAVLALVVMAFCAVVAAGTTFVNVSWMHPLIIGMLAIAPSFSRCTERDEVNGGIVFAGLLAAAASTIAIVLAKLSETGVISL